MTVTTKGAAMHNRRPAHRLAAVLACSIVLIGCGSDPAPSTVESSPSGEEGASQTRTVVDALGKEVTIPANPQRIVAINDLTAGMVLESLGIDLHGLCTRSGSFQPNFEERFGLEGVIGLGECYEPDIEKIINADPDVIVTESFQGEILLDPATIEQLYAIAPVYAIDVFTVPTDQYMDMIGEAFGVQDEVERQRAEFNNALDALSKQVPGAEELDIMRIDVGPGEPEFGLQGNGSVQQIISDALGGRRSPLIAEADTEENGGYLFLPLERLPEADADVLVVYLYGPGDPAELLPGWDTLEAVRNDQVLVLENFPEGPDQAKLYGYDYLAYTEWVNLLTPVMVAADLSIVTQ
jgi:iron complex transport system substrate-binding protein